MNGLGSLNGLAEEGCDLGLVDELGVFEVKQDGAWLGAEAVWCIVGLVGLVGWGLASEVIQGLYREEDGCREGVGVEEDVSYALDDGREALDGGSDWKGLRYSSAVFERGGPEAEPDLGGWLCLQDELEFQRGETPGQGTWLVIKLDKVGDARMTRICRITRVKSLEIGTWVLFIVASSTGLTGMLYAVTQSAWVAVVVMSVCVSVYIVENWWLHAEVVRLEQQETVRCKDMSTLKEALLHLTECNARLEWGECRFYRLSDRYHTHRLRKSFSV